MPVSIKDAFYMQKAIDLALKAKGFTSPNPIVGAVIVKNNEIIATGYHKKCGCDHAEIAALKQVEGIAKGATLYVTLEPCFHFGRTPPCVDAIIKSGIKKVFIAMKDPNPLVNGKSIRKLKDNGIEVKVGILKQEAQDINEPFLKYILKDMPFAAVKIAETLDGKIATHSGDSKWITSDETRKFARAIRDEFDAILVGINTVLKDDPCLCGVKKTKEIKKIILDSDLRISGKAKLFAGTKPGHCIIATTKRSSLIKRQQFLDRGIDVIICPLSNGKIDLKWLFKGLVKKGIISILIEGGANVIGSAIKAGLVDKVYCYIAPKIIGDQKALSSIVGIGTLKVDKAIKLEKLKFKIINQDILVEGYVLRNS